VGRCVEGWLLEAKRASGDARPASEREQDPRSWTPGVAYTARRAPITEWDALGYVPSGGRGCRRCGTLA
jgi:hypothetical protein